MTGLKRFIFRSLVAPVRLYARTMLDLRILGAHHIPTGPKIYAHNHISSLDTVWVLPVFPEPVHTIIGPAYASKIGSRALDYLEQINAMPEHRAAVVDRAVHYLRMGEPVHTAPEGDLQEDGKLGRFYPGVAKIYRKERAPIIPMALVAPKKAMRRIRMFDMTVGERLYKGIFVLRGPFFVNTGEPFTPEVRDDIDEKQENERIMQELKARIQSLVDEVRNNYPEATS